jgi:hypothetical protein
VVLSGFTAERAGNGKLSQAELRTMCSDHALLHHPVTLKVGEKAPSEVEEEEEEVRAEDAVIIGLVTQMSHHIPHSPQAMTHMTVQVCQIAVTTPQGVV